MTHRHIIVALGAIVALAGAATTPLSAQGGPPPADGGRRGPPPDRRGPPSVDDQLTHMTADLRLTPDQVTRVRAVLTAQRAAGDSAHARARANREADMRAMDANRDNTEKAITAILTPEQRTKHETLMRERRDHMGRGGPPRDGRGDRRGPPDAERGQR